MRPAALLIPLVSAFALTACQPDPAGSSETPDRPTLEETPQEAPPRQCQWCSAADRCWMDLHDGRRIE